MQVKLRDIKGTVPRREHGDIEGLKDSIREVGLIHPPTIDENLNLLAGRRRYQALMELYGPDYELNVTVLPVNGNRLKAFRVALLENLVRKPLTDPEVAASIKEYEEMEIMERGKGFSGQRSDLTSSHYNEVGWTHQDTANALGISRPAVVKAIKIATAIEESPDLARMTTGEAILREVKAQRRQSERERDAENIKGKQLPKSQLYATLVLDPPWDWGDEGDIDQLGRARPPYATMPLAEIAALPVGDLSLPDAHIYLWITNRSLPKGFGLLEGWGYRYITCLTWVKPSYGMGQYYRGSTEQVLFGVKGSLPLLVHDIPTHFAAPRSGLHSAKPDEFFALVERASPSPRLEMFARKERKGWEAWGNI